MGAAIRRGTRDNTRSGAWATIKAFADFLAVLEQNPEIQWTSLIDEIPVEEDRPTDMPEIADEGEEEAPEDGLSSFRI